VLKELSQNEHSPVMTLGKIFEGKIFESLTCFTINRNDSKLQINASLTSEYLVNNAT
jgi:hypothetical protein